MTKLMRIIDAVIMVELLNANAKHPQFHSRYEGLAVIQKELEEAKEEYRGLWKIISDIQYGIYLEDEADAVKILCNQARLCASMLACEAVQVAAMADKLYEYLNKEEKDAE